MKRLLSVLLIICLLSAFFVPAASAAIEGTCGLYGDNLTWEFDENTGVLTIEGSGEMQQIKTSNATPWASYASKIKRLELSEEMTSISAYAFYNCKALTHVDIPDSVVTVGDKAFSGCENLVTAVIGTGVEELGNKVFSSCPSLLALTLGGNSNLDVIPKATFEHSVELEVVYFNGTSKQWKNDIDVEGSNHIDSDIVECLESAEEGTSGSTDWVFDHMNFDLTISGTGAMRDYSSLGDRPWDVYESYIHTVIVQEGVTEIADRAFGTFTHMDRAYIAKSVTSVGNQAFASCDSLRDVYYGGTRTDWAAITMGSSNSDLTDARIHYAGECERHEVTPVYTPNGDETHTGKEVCGVCGMELSTPVIGTCGDEDADGKCDICGGEVAAKECTHPNATYEYVQNTEGVNHTKWLNCVDCGAHDNMGVEDCTDVNLNYICDNCGATIEGGTGGGEDPEDPTCAHTETTTETTYNNDNTHTTTVTCAAEGCGEVVSTTTADCTDDDIDYLCDVCEGQMEYVKYRYDVKTGTLTIYGNGAMDDYASGDDVPWAAIRSSINKVVIEEGVKHIGRRAFYNCASLTEVTIPASMESVDNYAFYRCSGLKTVKYGGTESMWSGIKIGLYNEPLINAARESSCLHENTTQVVSVNDDGTHTVTKTCQDCQLVLDPVTESCTEGEQTCTAGEGVHTLTVKCTVCERIMDEQTVACTDTAETTASNADRTHTTTVKCNTCGGTVSSETIRCTDGEDADKKCDTCGFDLNCSHPSYVKGYNANGDHKTHTYAYNCQICGEEIDAIRDEECSGTDGETCDLCGQDYSCQHNEEDLREVTEYHATDKTEVYTHNQMTVVYCDGEGCDLPGRIFSSEIVEEQNCADTDDDKCDLCGRDMLCGHEKTTTTNTHNGHNTHQLVVTCNICGDEVQNVEVDCTYRELGGTCMICKTACGHEYTYTYNKKTDAQQHYTEAVCDYCGYEQDTVTEDCVDAEPHDNVCDRCEADVVCDHEVKTVYVSNNNGTHMVINRCNSCTDQEAPCEKCEAFWGLEEAVACADGEDEDYTCDKCKYAYGEAAVNTVAYATFAEAMDAAENGDTIALLKDVELDEQLVIEKELIFDLGDHTLTCWNGGYEYDPMPYPDPVDPGYNYDPEYDESNESDAIVSEYGTKIRGKLTVKSGTFEILGTYGIMVYPGAELIIEGGEFNAAEYNDYLIGNWGTLVIRDGQFNGVYCDVNNFEGTTTITGGTFSTEDTDCTGEYEACDVLGDSGIAISGGVFSKPVYEGDCAEGYEPCDNSDGTYGVKEIEPIVKFNIAGANMTLGNDLKINFMIKKSDMQEGYVAKVSQAGAEPVALELWSYNAAYYAASYSVAAKEMTDVLSVEIYNADGKLVSNPFTRTIKQYAMTLLGNASMSDTLKSVVVDMLNYGAEAQKYFGHNTEALANAEVTEEQQTAYATADVECVDNQVKGANFVGANLSLEDSILLNVFFKNAAGMRAVVEYTDYLGVKQTYETTVEAYSSTMDKVVIDKIVLADAKCPVSVKVYDTDDVLHGEGVESVESYIARNLDNASTGDLNMAIMKFSTSAYNHLGGTN